MLGGSLGLLHFDRDPCEEGSSRGRLEKAISSGIGDNRSIIAPAKHIVDPQVSLEKRVIQAHSPIGDDRALVDKIALRFGAANGRAIQIVGEDIRRRLEMHFAKCARPVIQRKPDADAVSEYPSA